MQQQQRGKPEGELRAIRVVNFTHLILNYKTVSCLQWLARWVCYSIKKSVLIIKVKY